jgi:hypothetical protein
VRPAARGFSMSELLLLLGALLLLSFGVLDLLNRRSRIEAARVDELDRALARATRALERAVRLAGGGSVPDPITVSDNTPDGTSFPTARGPIAVRPGTDRLVARGVIEGPMLSLDALDPITAEIVSSPAASAHAGLLQRNPSDAPLRIPAWPRRSPVSGPGAGSRLLRIVARLRDALARPDVAPLFLVRDELGGWAVGRVRASDDAGLTEGCLAEGVSGSGREPCDLELRLDFHDPRAVAWNPGRDAGALQRLGRPFEGGLLDEETYFVARGESEDLPAADRAPASSKTFPRPYLAVARAAGPASYEVQRLADGIEDLQIAVRAADGRYAPDGPGTVPLAPAALSDALGRSAISMIKIALVAKSSSPAKLPRNVAWSSRAPNGLGGILLMNAPRPSASGSGPVGFARALEERVPFARKAFVVAFAPRNLSASRQLP